MHTLSRRGLALALAVSLCSCAALVSFLPKLLAVIDEAALIVQQIDTVEHAYFSAHPDAAAQAKVDEAIARTRNALALATHAADGAQDMDQAHADLALAEFRSAYADLIELTKPLGVKVANPGELMSASPGLLVVPEPAAIRVTR